MSQPFTDTTASRLTASLLNYIDTAASRLTASLLVINEGADTLLFELQLGSVIK
jgi:hypothetical protein